MAQKNSHYLQKAVAALVKNLSARNRDIVSRRFGLGTGEKETLESIGESYGITRERVRQIQDFALDQLTLLAAMNKDVSRHVAAARAIVERHGGVMKETELFKAYTGNEKASAANASLAFLLSMSKEISHLHENDHLHAVWAVNQEKLETYQETIASLVGALNSHGKPLVSEHVCALASESKVRLGGGQLNEKHLDTLLAVSKDLGRNIFNEIGLTSWPQVRPKGVRDKAYLVMKKENKPLHFTNIARAINTASFDHKKVNIQTVHNELIKDKRFVLVGRGMYALAEWGYQPGTVKDVLVSILKDSSGPLSRADLVTKVKNARLVKENTIVLNLQDSSTFVRNGDGTYTLKRA